MSIKENIKSLIQSSTKEVIVKRFILLGIFAFFFILLLQQKFHYIKKYKVTTLDGYFEPKTYTDFSISSWITSDYQNNTNDYLRENFGFRNLFVRLNNEVKFLFFNKTNARDVIIGKENYLYDVNYINTYNAFEYPGDKVITDTINSLKKLQDTLKSLGKHFLLVIAPSKARIYPEYIPDGYIHPINETSYYGAYSEGLKKAGVNFIDFNHLFLQKKASSPELLIPQLGTHWSRLEAVKAADTIFRRLSYLAQMPLPQIQINSLQTKYELESPDDDVIKSMNLLFYPKHGNMSYPEFSIQTKDKSMKNILVISDSYWWDIYLRDIPKNVFANHDFWYYFKDVWGNNYLGKRDIKTVDVKRSLLQNDFVLLITSESNLDKMGFGFIGSASQELKRQIQPTNEEMELIEDRILKNSDWVKQIYQKAKMRNISFEELLHQDAAWFFQHNGPARTGISLNDLKESIINNPDWMSQIKNKAASLNQSTDSVLENEAVLFMKDNLKMDPYPTKTKSKNYKEVIEKIKANNDWFTQVKNKAILQGVDLELMLILDALWQIEYDAKQKNSAKKPANFTEVVKHIKDTPEWLNEIKSKAKKRHLSVDSMITLDALWYMKENHLK